jgi:hypothetical protein
VTVSEGRTTSSAAGTKKEVPQINTKLLDDSENWDSDEEEVYCTPKYSIGKTTVANTKKKSRKTSKHSDLPKPVVTATNPFVLTASDKENSEAGIPVIKAENGPEIETKQVNEKLEIEQQQTIVQAAVIEPEVEKESKEQLQLETTNDLDNYVTAPFEIPNTRNESFFTVELFDINSPSQFLFLHNKDQLLVLQHDMR